MSASAQGGRPGTVLGNLEAGEREDADHGWRAAYPDKARMEYFSKHHHRWLVAQLHHAPLRERLSYNIRAGNNPQLRIDCSLASMRMPLAKNEPIDFYSVRDDKWLPASVLGQQSMSAATVGYRIRLDSGARARQRPQGADQDESKGRTMSRVPANRVRRRFDPDYEVEFYQGDELGWVRATVLDEHDPTVPPDSGATEAAGREAGSYVHPTLGPRE